MASPCEAIVIHLIPWPMFCYKSRQAEKRKGSISAMRHSYTVISGALMLLCAGLVIWAGVETARASVPSGALPAAPADGTEALPSGVFVQTVLPNMVKPIAMAFDPQGRLFYTEKETGRVRLFANGTLQPDPVINFQVQSASERGLLGIAVDPNFSQNHYLYVYYTCRPGANCATLENRVARF